jgi:hypothetical protein
MPSWISHRALTRRDRCSRPVKKALVSMRLETTQQSLDSPRCCEGVNTNTCYRTWGGGRGGEGGKWGRAGSSHILPTFVNRCATSYPPPVANFFERARWPSMSPPVLESLMFMLILHLPCSYAAMTTPGEAGSAMRRRDVLKGATAAAALAQQPSAALAARVPASAGPTNEVVGVVDGIRQKRLGGSGIIVSEVGLGTQRWGSTDFNAPDMAACHALMDRAILESGVNLIDTAEQYPIPSDDLTGRFEGYTEQIIGRWLAKDKALTLTLTLTLTPALTLALTLTITLTLTLIPTLTLTRTRRYPYPYPYP